MEILEKESSIVYLKWLKMADNKDRICRESHTKDLLDDPLRQRMSDQKIGLINW